MPTVKLSLLSLIVALPLADAAAQTQSVDDPAQFRLESAGESDPNWPGELESWDSDERDPDGDPGEAERRDLTGQDVEESQPPEPTDQGNRSPEATDSDDLTLYERLARLRAAPPGLDGQPIQRPNHFASEPAKEMQPAQPRNAFLFPEDYIE